MSVSKRLLIVDDSEADREIMSDTLGAAFPGACVRQVEAPELVGPICDVEPFDCVLLDYNMPKIDGLTLARLLRARNAYLPIILVTNVGDEMLVADALREGVSDYITKSRITPESILRTITRSVLACDQARLIDEQRAELENFAYALAHDFKQPIRQIITFSELISEAIGSTDDADTLRHLRFLSTAADRLGKLVDVMSQYTLLNQPPELSDVDMAVVISAVSASLGPFLAERSGQLVASAGAPMVRANETLMIQILQNLIVNGVLYNRSSPPRVEIKFHSQGDQWAIDVSDNGLGIEAEFLSEIFKPLIRLHTAAEFPGTGLGLTLARKAVLAQNGSISCESVVGRGSVFHIRLPAAGAGDKGDGKGELRSAA